MSKFGSQRNLPIYISRKFGICDALLTIQDESRHMNFSSAFLLLGLQSNNRNDGMKYTLQCIVASQCFVRIFSPYSQRKVRLRRSAVGKTSSERCGCICIWPGPLLSLMYEDIIIIIIIKINEYPEAGLTVSISVQHI